MEPHLSATTVWPVTAELIIELDARFGPPVDCYVNGTQTWLTNDGPNETMLEWRLHPAGGYVTPSGLSHYEVFETVVAALSVGADATQLNVGDDTRDIRGLWSGLECFSAYGDVNDPAVLAHHAGLALGTPPEIYGVVDHQAITERWLASNRAVDLYGLVRTALTNQ